MMPRSAPGAQSRASLADGIGPPRSVLGTAARQAEALLGDEAAQDFARTPVDGGRDGAAVVVLEDPPGRCTRLRPRQETLGANHVQNGGRPLHISLGTEERGQRTGLRALFVQERRAKSKEIADLSVNGEAGEASSVVWVVEEPLAIWSRRGCCPLDGGPSQLGRPRGGSDVLFGL